MRSRRRQNGFSLIEALVVLVIGGMALAIIFSIGTKAGDTGFSLGRRALTASDSDVASSDVRSLIRSLALRPAKTFVTGVDQPIVGRTDRLESDAVMERANQCAPQGWAGRLVLAIETEGAEKALYCEASGRRTALITGVRGEAALTYSTDGETWTSSYTNAPAELTFGPLASQRLYVRFSAPNIDVIEVASSGRPEPWVRSNAQF